VYFNFILREHLYFSVAAPQDYFVFLYGFFFLLFSTHEGIVMVHEL